MCGDVENFDVISAKDILIVRIDTCVRKKLFSALLGSFPAYIAERNYVVASVSVGPEMVSGDATAADQANRRIVVLGILGAILDVNHFSFHAEIGGAS
jgi:hypothetical protein